MFRLKFNHLSKRNIIHLLSFFIPISIMIIIFAIKGIFPFGSRSFLRTDLYHQYAPFYSELQYKLQNFKSLLYSYHVGLGTNFLTLISYYLSSPFNILLFFISDKYVIEFITYSIVFKIGLSSLTFSYYLTNRFNHDKLYIAIFSIFYAMSGYIAAYSWNIMWLDCIWLFPLLILGFDKMFYNKKPFLYIITLALSIITNYYIATMECFFIIIYFFVCVTLSNIKTFKTFFYKALDALKYSILGISISCFMLIPTIYAFITTGSSEFEFPKRLNEYFPILDVLARHMINVKIENGLDHWPNIYCGVFVVFLFILYLFNKKIKFKEKITYILLLLFFYASFSINIMNFVWHVFKYPNSLPARQSFIYVFFILLLSYKSFIKIKSLDKYKLQTGLAISIVFILLLNKLVINDKIEFHSYYVSLIFILFYFFILYLYLNKNINLKYLFFICMLIVSLEAFINMFNTSVTTIDRNKYVEDYNDIKQLTNKAYDINNDYFRMERINRTAKDDGAFFHFPSASIFSSTAYKDGTDFYKRVGCEASMNAYSITGSTPFIDSLLGIKYEFYGEEQKDNNLLNIRLIDKANKVHLYQNIDTLPLSFVLDDKLSEIDYKSTNPATVQNNFSRAINIKSLLHKIDININGKTAKFNVTEDGNYFAFIRDKNIEEVTVQYQKTSKKFKNLDRGYFIHIGVLKKGEDIELRNDYNDKELLAEVFRFNYDSLKQFNEYVLDKSQFNIESYSDTSIVYNINSKIDGKCVVTLPYDKGWNILVDGKKVETKKLYDFFISFDIDKGEHIVEMKFFPEGLNIGIIVNLLGILLTGLLYFYNKNNNKFIQKYDI